MVTSIIPIYNNSFKCDNKLLLKTLVIPILDHTDSTYILISKDSVISKKTRMFGSEINIIGRTCIIHESINATSTPSPDPLFKNLNFNFEGNITIEENCPLNGSIHSSKWTFQSKATIKLPIICSLSSEKINCDAVKLKSGATKELHLSHYRMQIMEQTFEKEKIEKNSTKFVKPEIDQVITIKPQPKSLLETIKWPLIGGGASLISIIY